MNKKSLKLSWILYAVGLFLCLFLLCSANSIISLFFPKEEVLHPIKLSEIESNCQPVVTSISLSYMGGTFESVYVNGIAQCDPTILDGRKINLILKQYDSDNAYISYNDAQSYGESHISILTTVRTFNIPIGYYEVYLNVIDNEDIYGLANTSRVFRKTSNDFFEVTREEVKQAFQKDENSVAEIIGGNLLINSNFKINQRGKDVYQADRYTVDHWRKNMDGSIYVTDNGVKLSNGALVRQYVDNYENLRGEEISFSAKVNGKIVSATFIYPNNNNGCRIYEDDDTLRVTIYNSASEGTEWLVLTAKVEGVEIEWAKLEVGGTATKYVPPEPGLELLKCQRYYQIRSEDNIPAVDLRPTMRTTPTVSAVSNGYGYDAEY